MHQALSVGSSITVTDHFQLRLGGYMLPACTIRRSVMRLTRAFRAASVLSLPFFCASWTVCAYACADEACACSSETSTSCLRPDTGLVWQPARTTASRAVDSSRIFIAAPCGRANGPGSD